MKNKSKINFQNDLKRLLEDKYLQYNHFDFIENDPIQIPHLFSIKEDKEIAGFFAATLAWGQRKTIIKNATNLMRLMDNAPYHFVLNHTSNDLNTFSKFAHRTFNGTDCCFFVRRLSMIYKQKGGLEAAFADGITKEGDAIDVAIMHFRKVFFGSVTPNRSFKHISNPHRNSSAKRLCMFLRWMVRQDKSGCDFGIWKSIKPAQLCLPLDVHTGKVARSLGLLKRKQDDWKAVTEVTASLREFDHYDPVKYDFALFGMGVNRDIV